MLRRAAASRAGQVFLGLMLVGWLSYQVGIGRDPAPVRPETADSERSSAPSLAAKITAARELARNSPIIEVRARNPELQLTWVSEEQVAVIRDRDGVTVVDSQGRQWLRRTGCWDMVAQGRPHSLESVFLVLDEDSARFTSMREENGTTQVRFEAEKMGSYGSGRGILTLDQDGMITGLSYQSDDRAPRFSARFAYLADAEVPKVAPRCE